jgi:phosphate/sulfate permease
VGINIVTAWILTIPGAGLVAALSYQLIHLVVE